MLLNRFRRTHTPEIAPRVGYEVSVDPDDTGHAFVTVLGGVTQVVYRLRRAPLLPGEAQTSDPEAIPTVL